MLSGQGRKHVEERSGRRVLFVDQDFESEFQLSQSSGQRKLVSLNRLEEEIREGGVWFGG